MELVPLPQRGSAIGSSTASASICDERSTSSGLGKGSPHNARLVVSVE